MTAGGLGVGDVRGIGVDAVDLARFRRVLERRPSLRERVFSAAEQSYAARGADAAAHLAARFAAKEAVLKALGVGIDRVALREVEIVRAEGGSPGVVLTGRAEALAKRRGVRRWHVSLSHTGALAVATALAEGEGAP